MRSPGICLPKEEVGGDFYSWNETAGLSTGSSPERRNAFQPRPSRRSATSWNARPTTSNPTCRCAPRRPPTPRRSQSTLASPPVRRSLDGSACCHRMKMPRPRKAGDPVRWPEPYGRCGEHHQIAVRWPDGGICGYCYQQAKRTRGTCAWGHEGVLPGRVDTLPACRSCSGVQLKIDCIGCGNEDELHSGNRCWSCILAATVDRLLSPPDNQPPSLALRAVAAALKSMKRANSGMAWNQQPHVTAFLHL